MICSPERLDPLTRPDLTMRMSSHAASSLYLAADQQPKTIINVIDVRPSSLPRTLIANVTNVFDINLSIKSASVHLFRIYNRCPSTSNGDIDPELPTQYVFC